MHPVSVEVRGTRSIHWINEHIQEQKPMCHKTLESYGGTLVYISRTYPSLVPYLKGIHLTLDSWRNNRDSKGWKLSASDPLFSFDDAASSHLPPKVVMPVPQLIMDIQALLALFEPAVPLTRQVHPTSTATVLYGFGDASLKILQIIMNSIIWCCALRRVYRKVCW